MFQELIAEKFPNLGNETDIQIQDTQRTCIKINKSRPTENHILIKLAKYSNKEKNFKATKEDSRGQ